MNKLKANHFAYICSVFLLFLTSNCFALTAYVGTYNQSFGRLHTSTDGGINYFQLRPFLSVSHTWPGFGSSLFVPELGFVLDKSEDNHNSYLIYLNADFKNELMANIDFRYGLGFLANRVSGDGDPVILGNGSSTATFFQPGEAKTSILVSLNLGADVTLVTNLYLRAQLYLIGLLDSDQRSLNTALSVGYTFLE